MMGKEPDNLVLEPLRGMRGDIQDVRDGLKDVREDNRGLRRVQDSHTLRFDFLEERVETLRESTMTALGYAVDASERKKKIETRLSYLSARVEMLEKAK